eukprot:scaffold1518_cov417-Prasinococcus_capsulatus_cf.AAC.28
MEGTAGQAPRIAAGAPGPSPYLPPRHHHACVAAPPPCAIESRAATPARAPARTTCSRCWSAVQVRPSGPAAEARACWPRCAAEKRAANRLSLRQDCARMRALSHSLAVRPASWRYAGAVAVRRRALPRGQAGERPRRSAWTVTASGSSHHDALLASQGEERTHSCSRRCASEALLVLASTALACTGPGASIASAYGLNKSPPPPDDFSLFGLKYVLGASRFRLSAPTETLPGPFRPKLCHARLRGNRGAKSYNVQQAAARGEKARDEKEAEEAPGELVTLPSGIQYREILEGRGAEAVEGATCEMMYADLCSNAACAAPQLSKLCVVHTCASLTRDVVLRRYIVYRLSSGAYYKYSSGGQPVYLWSTGFGFEGKDDVGEVYRFVVGQRGDLPVAADVAVRGMRVGEPAPKTEPSRCANPEGRTDWLTWARRRYPACAHSSSTRMG